MARRDEPAAREVRLRVLDLLEALRRAGSVVGRTWEMNAPRRR